MKDKNLTMYIGFVVLTQIAILIGLMIKGGEDIHNLMYSISFFIGVYVISKTIENTVDDEIYTLNIISPDHNIIKVWDIKKKDLGLFLPKVGDLFFKLAGNEYQVIKYIHSSQNPTDTKEIFCMVERIIKD